MTAQIVDAPIPSVKLDATTIPREHHFDAYREAVSPVLELSPSEDRNDFEFAIEAYNIDEILFSTSRYHKINFGRKRKHIQSRDDFVVLQMFQSGSERVTAEYGHRLMAPDSIVLRDWARSFDGAGDASFQFGVNIPRSLLKSHDLLYTKHPYISWPIASPVGSMISTAWMNVWRSLPESTYSEGETITSGFLGLLNGILAERPTPSESDLLAEATLEAVKVYLLENLDNPNLTVDRVCDRFCCSRAKLYRIFKKEGGIHAFLRDQRLARCYDELSSPNRTPHNTRVATIARKYGFEDPSHFSTAFKQTFGLTPMDVLAMAPLENSFSNTSWTTESLIQVDRVKKWLTPR